MRRSCATRDRAASCIDVCALSGHRRQRMPSVGTRESERSEAPFFCACIVLGLPFPWGQEGLATRRSCATRDSVLCIEVCALKTSPLLGAAFAPGRTAGVGVVFPAGASVMAPDAQLLPRSPRVLMTSNSRLSPMLRDEGHHRP